ncbi:hypothetical protein Peur_046157 [Populus x canadensis]
MKIPCVTEYSITKYQDKLLLKYALLGHIILVIIPMLVLGSEPFIEETKEILQKAVEQSSTIFHSEGKVPVDEMRKSTPPLTSHPEDACSNEREHRGEENSDSHLNQGVQHIIHLSQLSKKRLLTFQPPIKLANISGASISISYAGDKLPDDFSPRDLNDFFLENRTIGEDQSTFLSALHGMEGSLPRELNYSPEGFASDPNDSQLRSPNEEVLDDFSLGLDSEGAGVEKTAYDPSLWTPIEIATATDNADCMFVEHPLKLKSTCTS